MKKDIQTFTENFVYDALAASNSIKKAKNNSEPRSQFDNDHRRQRRLKKI